MQSADNREQTKYEKLFQSIFTEITTIEKKVEGTLSFGKEKLVKCVEQTPSVSPLERDLNNVLERLVELKNSIN
jgi:hypothetical protein